jgi:hypothetical protein
MTDRKEIRTHIRQLIGEVDERHQKMFGGPMAHSDAFRLAKTAFRDAKAFGEDTPLGQILSGTKSIFFIDLLRRWRAQSASELVKERTETRRIAESVEADIPQRRKVVAGGLIRTTLYPARTHDAVDIYRSPQGELVKIQPRIRKQPILAFWRDEKQKK